MQSDQRFSMTELSGRQTSSSYGMSDPYDYFHCSVVMMIIYMLCLNVVVVLACSLPALWFARKVSHQMRRFFIYTLKSVYT